MGFLDRAKRLADQAQAKLDEIQRQVNESRGHGAAPPSGAPAVQYDQHGRRVPHDPAPPQGDPIAAPAPAPPRAQAPAGGEAPAAQPDPVDETPPHGDPLRDAGPRPPSTPKLTSGDPLAG